jgi:hypothetical protein
LQNVTLGHLKREQGDRDFLTAIRSGGPQAQASLAVCGSTAVQPELTLANSRGCQVKTIQAGSYTDWAIIAAIGDPRPLGINLVSEGNDALRRGIVSLYTGGARFGPDGKSVVYVVKDKVSNLWMQPLDESPGHQITNFTSDLITGFRWSPDRKTLAVLRTHNTSDVVVLRETNE